MTIPLRSRLRSRSIAALAVGFALATAACGSDAPAPAASDSPTATNVSTVPDATSPDTTGASSGAEVPTRIVSLSPTATEMMFAIGAGDQLIAVDDQSNYPAEALDLPHEMSSFEPNVEAIAGYEPDLVLIGGDFTGLGPQLDALGIAWWDGPAAMTIDDTYRQIEQLGDITGNSESADALVKEMHAAIEAAVLATPVPAEPLSLYHELDPTFYSADSTTFIGELYAMLGLTNIADGAEGDSGGYPQLSAEFIVSANPDLIFLADSKCCGEGPDTVATRPGWDAIAAVANGNVFAMDDDIASRWGPRVVDYLKAVSAAVQQAS